MNISTGGSTGGWNDVFPGLLCRSQHQSLYQRLAPRITGHKFFQFILELVHGFIKAVGFGDIDKGAAGFIITLPGSPFDGFQRSFRPEHPGCRFPHLSGYPGPHPETQPVPPGPLSNSPIRLQPMAPSHHLRLFPKKQSPTIQCIDCGYLRAAIHPGSGQDVPSSRDRCLPQNVHNFQTLLFTQFFTHFIQYYPIAGGRFFATGRADPAPNIQSDLFPANFSGYDGSYPH